MDDIEQSQRRKYQGTHPLPTPGRGEDEEQDGGGDEVQGQGQQGVPETVIFLEHIQREQADEGGEEEADNPGGPEQEAFSGCIHNGVLSHGSTSQ